MEITISVKQQYNEITYKVKPILLSRLGSVIHFELFMLNQAPAVALFAAWAANIHYPPPCRYKPFLSMAVQCYRGGLYGRLFPAWHHWWMAAVVTVNMFPSHLEEPHAHCGVAHWLLPAVSCFLALSLGMIALMVVIMKLILRPWL